MRSNVEIKKSLLLIGSASAFVRRVLGLTVLFWMWQYLIRRIPAEEFVLYPISMGIVALMPLVQVALASGLGRYLTEAHARGDARRVTEITSTPHARAGRRRGRAPPPGGRVRLAHRALPRHRPPAGRDRAAALHAARDPHRAADRLRTVSPGLLRPPAIRAARLDRRGRGPPAHGIAGVPAHGARAGRAGDRCFRADRHERGDLCRPRLLDALAPRACASGSTPCAARSDGRSCRSEAGTGSTRRRRCCAR